MARKWHLLFRTVQSFLNKVKARFKVRKQITIKNIFNLSPNLSPRRREALKLALFQLTNLIPLKLAPFPTREGGWGLGLILFHSFKNRYITSYLSLFTLFLLLTILPVVAQAPSITQDNSNPSILLQQSKTLYEAGKFSEAITLLQQAADAFKNSGDRLRQAMTLSNLSLALQQQEKWQEAEQASTESLKLLQSNQDEDKNRLGILAQTLDVKAKLLLSTGNPKQALNLWQESAQIYTKLGDNNSLTKNQINQSLALQDLGHYLQAWKLLISSLQALQNQPDSLVKATGLRSLGNVLRVVGDVEDLDKLLPDIIKGEKKYLKQSELLLRESLEISQNWRSPIDSAEALLGLGNTARAAYISARDAYDRVETEQAKHEAETQIKKAVEHYQEAATTTPSKITQIQAKLNHLSILLDWEKWGQKIGKNELSEWQLKQLQRQLDNLPNLQSQINNLPPSRVAVYTRINLVQSLMQLSVSQGKKQETIDIEQLLNTALEQAQQIKDTHSIAYALGYLGKWYEQTEKISEARDLTERALLLTEDIQARDIAYQWQWQLGRILKKQGKREGAIAAYEVAIKTLESLRQDILSFNKPPDFQFSFRDNVEPVYRELVELLLDTSSISIKQENLKKARQTIEDLQLAELENFLRCRLVDKNSVPIDNFIAQNNLKAAAIYTIITEKQLEVIIKLPQINDLVFYKSTIAKSELETNIQKLREDIKANKVGKDTTAKYQEFYNLLLKQAEPYLPNNKINTLVFVLDGYLRSIPIAALYDGQQYVVEKYNVVVNLGLQLVDNKPLKKGEFKALMAGMTEERQGLKPLLYVKGELEKISSQVPKSKVLLDQEFTTQALQDQITSQPFPVVHLATHGQFSSSPDETHILAYDNFINVNQLDKFLQSREEKQHNAIELLVLSACQTATGDKRAALGIAGVSVKAGARSTIASLWNTNDSSAALLMESFYQELGKPNVTKAEALRKAQLNLLKQYKLPLYWAPYILVGNWR